MEYRKWYDSYPPGVPHTINYPHLPLKDHFLQRVEEHPDRDYIIWENIRISYEQCNTLSRKLSNSLIEMGYKKQDRIALATGNRPEYIIALQAGFKIGAAVVPTNPRFKTEELLQQFRGTGASIAIITEQFAYKAIDIMQSGKTTLEHIIIIDDSTSMNLPNCKGIHSWNQVINEGQDMEPDITVSPEDIAILQHSGGTTGVPKAVILSNSNLEAMAYMTYHWFTPPLDGDVIRCLVPLPLYHVIGFGNNVNFNLIGGGTVILIDSPTPEKIINNINQYEPNYFTAVPSMLAALSHYPDTKQSKIGKLKGMMVGGAPLPLEVHKEFEEIYGLKIMQGYGLSETVTISCTPFFREQKPGTVGLPYPDTDVKVVDVEDGITEMPTGTPGELIVKGPQVMTAYWNNPEETSRVFNQDGWFYTGDIVTQDEDGYITIVDRKKDLIISSGFNVYPREIDEVVYTHPSVLEACTVGIPDKKRGESAKVFIVLKPGKTLEPQEILDHCREHLADYKVPVSIEFRNELPKTAVGKLSRVGLRKLENIS